MFFYEDENFTEDDFNITLNPPFRQITKNLIRNGNCQYEKVYLDFDDYVI